MWHAFEITWYVLELISSWRLILCVVASLAVAVLIDQLYPGSTHAIFFAATIAGSVVGVAWELTSLFRSGNSW
jgi:hypothetical protein